MHIYIYIHINMNMYIYIHKNSIFKHPLTSTSPSSASSEMVHRTPMPKAFAMKSMSITSTQPVARISSHLEVSRSRSRTLSIVVFMNLRARSSSVFTILWLVEYPEFFRGTVFHTSKSKDPRTLCQKHRPSAGTQCSCRSDAS